MKTMALAKAYDSLVRTNSDRPLKNLSKEQLLVYPQADPSDIAYGHFCRELVHRRAIEVAIKNAVTIIEDKMKEAAKYWAKAILENPDARKKYESTQVRLKAEKEAAQAEVDKLKDNPYVVTHGEIANYFRGRHWNEYSPLLDKFVAGTLFECQAYGWAAFLTVDYKVHRQDLATFDKLAELASVCSDEDGVTFKNIRAMWAMRMVPSMSMRARFTDDGSVANVAAFSRELKKEYWTWFRRYNTATVIWNWKDDSGVAFDDRVFSVNMDIEEKL